MWYSQIEVSIGRSLKAKGGEEEEENKLFMAFRRKAKSDSFSGRSCLLPLATICRNPQSIFFGEAKIPGSEGYGTCGPSVPIPGDIFCPQM